jgi:ABC-type uncharacterized transport system involved in gliding motility auxiliary subunit
MADRILHYLAYVALVLGAGSLVLGLLLWGLLGQFGREPRLLMLWGAALLVVFAVLEFETVGQLIATRGVQGGANLALRGLALLGIVVLLNVLASQHGFKRDLTGLRINTLAPQTLKVLHDLKQPVQVDAFYRPNSPGQADAHRLLERYHQENPANFQVRIIDPDVEPGAALQAGATEGTVIFTFPGHPAERVQTAQEQDFTSALIKLTSTQKVKIYFLTGHGEGVLSGGGNGLTIARRLLAQEGYTVEELNLVGEQPNVPADASAVVIAGSKQALADPELRALSTYLEKGGRALVMNAPFDFDKTNLSRLLEPFGLAFDKGVVADPTRHATVSVYAPAAATYPTGVITRDLTNQNTFMVNASPVSRRDVKDVTLTPIWETTRDAYAITDGNLSRGFDGGKDRKGPFTLMFSAERKAPAAGASPRPSGPASPGATRPPATRVVAAGSWEFAGDRVITSGANGALLLGTINWLAGQEQLISIPPREGTTPTVSLDSVQRSLVFLGTVVVLPLLILLAGVGVWVRRSLRV